LLKRLKKIKSLKKTFSRANILLFHMDRAKQQVGVIFGGRLQSTVVFTLFTTFNRFEVPEKRLISTKYNIRTTHNIAKNFHFHSSFQHFHHRMCVIRLPL
jgi:hypothetical protein